MAVTLPPHWKQRFFTIWIGQAFSLFGSSLAGFALIWWMTKETGSATILAIATLITMLPGIFIGPFAGALIDRWDRRKVMIIADLTGAIAAAALALLFASGQIQVWHIYSAMFVRSLAGAFHFPAMQSSTSLMVPDEHLTRIAGLNQMLQGASSIVAPALGALLVAWLPFAGIMAVDIITALLAVATLFVVPIPSPVHQDQESPASLLSDTREGLRYIWHWKGLRYTLFVATFINLLLTPAFSLLPILVTRYFGGAAAELAAMEAVSGIGMIAGGVVLGVWGGFKRRVFTMILGLVGLSLGTLVIGIAPASLLIVGLIGMFIVGMAAPFTNGPFMAIVQSLVPANMQGRVFTVMGSVSMGVSPLGLLIAGPLADRFGVQVWYIAGAAMCFVLLVLCLLTPTIMHLEDHHAEQALSPI